MDAFRGIGLILTHPRLWPLCAAPSLGAITAYTLLAWLAIARIPEDVSFRPLWVIGALVGAALLCVALQGAFIGLIFDPLARAAERIASGEEPPACPLTFSELLADSLSRLGYNLFLSLLALIFSFLGGIPGLLAAGVIGLLDYTSPGYLRRGIRLKEQRQEFFKTLDREAISFGAIVGVCTLIPVLGLLLAPAFIVGGALLARRRLTAPRT